MAAVRNRLCKVAHCTVPVIGAPMLGYGDVVLARAVASTGAVGSVPCSGMAPPDLAALVRDNAGQRLCYNFFCHRPPAEAALSPSWLERLKPYYAAEGVCDGAAAMVQRRLDALKATHFTAEQLEALLEVQSALRGGPPLLLSFHFGLPSDDLWARLRGAANGCGFCVSCSATTVEEAVFLKQRGVDIVVCQGAEAGGHRGLFLPSSRVEEQPGTFALVPQVRAALGSDACLVAAGGVVDATTARAAVVLGADGVQVGTSYLRTPEARTTPVHRRALRDALASGASATSVTNILSGRPARGLRNRLMEDLGSMRGDAPAYTTGPSYLVDLRQRAEAAGRGDYSQLWAGQNLRGCTECSAAEKTLDIAAAFTQA